MKKPDKDSLLQFESALSAAYKAISGEENSQVIFADDDQDVNILKENNLKIPRPRAAVSKKKISAIRGSADSAALQLRYHNSKIHQKYLPQNQDAIDLFNAAENARIESLGAINMKGVAKNINAKITEHFQKNGYNSLNKLKAAPLDEVLALIIRKQLTGKNLPKVTEKMMEKWGNTYKLKLSDYLENLKENIQNQENFAKIIKDIIKDLESLEGENEQREEGDNSDESQSGKEQQDETSEEPESEEQKKSLYEVVEGNKNGEAKAGQIMQDQSDSSSDEPALRRNWEYKPEHFHEYKIFTNEFDQIIKAEELCDIEELIHLRKQLDLKLSKLKAVTRKHANQFLHKLQARQKRTWQFGLESGVIDSSKLALLIADPNYLEYYKAEKITDNNDTVVTLLLDNSGSMRGRPITVAAMSAEILSKTLESCGIKVEILGFTTVEWKGGKSRAKWINDNSPKNPGRLNDLRHIIYKSADMPWRGARKNLGIMLKEGILKENIDGEAISWACSRLAFRPEKRRILMVISDGAPVDDSTISSNSPSYLDNNLKDIIHLVEKHHDIEMIAIGIGHDVTRYYDNAVIIRDVDELGDAMFKELGELLDAAA